MSLAASFYALRNTHYDIFYPALREVSMTIQAIYWDIGGVLVRTEDRAPRTELAKRLGMTSRDLEELVFGGEHGRQAQSGQISAAEQWAYVCQTLNWPVAEWKTLEQEFFRGDRFDTDLLGYIRSLRPRYKTGVISNALSDVRPMAEGSWGMAEAFDTLIFSAEIGIMKPDPRIFHHALQALGVQPAGAVFIDDFQRNIDGAQAIGMHAILFQSPAQVRADLEMLLNEKEEERKENRK